jgi:hypothetical protein
LKRAELAKKFMELSKTSWFEAIRHDDDEKALILVDEIIELGWVPIEDFPDDELPVPTQPVVNDIMERIISGLPERVLKPANPEGHAVYPMGKLYDVASLHPVEVDLNELAKSGAYHFSSHKPREFVSDYHRIPDFDNYEINSFGEIRNRWTKRVLEVTENCGEDYVDMHDKDGFEHTINVRFVREKVFGG